MYIYMWVFFFKKPVCLKLCVYQFAVSAEHQVYKATLGIFGMHP